MIVIDTTVLVYAKGTEHRLKAPCRELIEAIVDGAIEATTSIEAIQEFVHVRSRRRDRRDAALLGHDYAELFSPLLAITEEELRRGLSLFQDIDALGAFDSVLAATAMANRATAIVSSDAAFSRVPTIRHVVPDADGVASLLDTH